MICAPYSTKVPLPHWTDLNSGREIRIQKHQRWFYVEGIVNMMIHVRRQWKDWSVLRNCQQIRIRKLRASMLRLPWIVMEKYHCMLCYCNGKKLWVITRRFTLWSCSHDLGQCLRMEFATWWTHPILNGSTASQLFIKENILSICIWGSN